MGSSSKGSLWPHGLGRWTKSACVNVYMWVRFSENYKKVLNSKCFFEYRRQNVNLPNCLLWDKQTLQTPAIHHPLTWTHGDWSPMVTWRDWHHDANLRAVMERARETGLRFINDKYKIRCTEIPFFGHIISASDLRPDPQKMEAIDKMDPSGSLADLQSFLGMTQFLSRFVPNLASISSNLWDLTKESSDFQ